MRRQVGPPCRPGQQEREEPRHHQQPPCVPSRPTPARHLRRLQHSRPAVGAARALGRDERQAWSRGPVLSPGVDTWIVRSTYRVGHAHTVRAGSWWKRGRATHGGTTHHNYLVQVACDIHPREPWSCSESSDLHASLGQVLEGLRPRLCPVDDYVHLVHARFHGRRDTGSLIVGGARPDGNAVAAATAATVEPASSRRATATGSGYTQTAATGRTAGSVGLAGGPWRAARRPCPACRPLRAWSGPLSARRRPGLTVWRRV